MFTVTIIKIKELGKKIVNVHSMSSSSSSAMETTAVLIPRYEMVPGSILKPVEDAASVVQGSSDEGSEYLAMSLVESMLAAAVPDGSVIILPLTLPTDGQVIDFTYKNPAVILSCAAEVPSEC
jgi:hypothetical protein